MAVSLLDLKPQNEAIRAEIESAISKVIDSQHFILGADVKMFEEEAAEYLGVKYALGVSSGTDALLMALMAFDIGVNDEVITTPYSFFATAGSIARLGAIPKFVDIEPNTFNIDPKKISDSLSAKTKAIMPVHLFGQSANMDEINDVAKRNDLKVIEDSAQAIGAKFNQKMVGTIGDIGCFSFFPSKNLGCFGDAGLVTTNDKGLYEKLLSIRNHGMVLNERYKHQFVGGNFRIDTIQSAILRVKLPKLEGYISSRRNNANLYKKLLSERLSSLALQENSCILPLEYDLAYHTFNQFVVRIPFRDAFLKAAAEKEVGVMVYYPIPLHLQPCFKSLGYSLGDLPESERAALESVALPVYPEIPQGDIEEVVDLLVEVGRKEGAW